MFSCYSISFLSEKIYPQNYLLNLFKMFSRSIGQPRLKMNWWTQNGKCDYLTYFDLESLCHSKKIKVMDKRSMYCLNRYISFIDVWRMKKKLLPFIYVNITFTCHVPSNRSMIRQWRHLHTGENSLILLKQKLVGS